MMSACNDTQLQKCENAEMLQKCTLLELPAQELATVIAGRRSVHFTFCTASQEHTHTQETDMEFYVGMVVLHHALVYCIIGTRTCVEVEKTAPRNVMQWIVSVANCEGAGLPK